MQFHPHYRHRPESLHVEQDSGPEIQSINDHPAQQAVAAATASSHYPRLVAALLADENNQSIWAILMEFDRGKMLFSRGFRRRHVVF